MKRKTSIDFINEAKQIYGEKYDYSSIIYKNFRTKIQIRCSLHGIFEKFPQDFLKGSGCKQCSYEKMDKKERSTEEFIIDAKKIHGEKYDYSKVHFVSLAKKIEIICPIHGSWLQKPGDHLNSKAGCKKCFYEKSGKTEWTTKSLIEKLKEIHGDTYDFSNIDYENNTTKVKIICSIHGEIEISPKTLLRGEGVNNVPILLTD